MNERIKELAEQAGYEKDMFGIGHWDMPECKKFAELIIEECVEVAHPKLTDVGEWAAGMRLVQKRLKQHFGVEE
jgi:hypothetical protein